MHLVRIAAAAAVLLTSAAPAAGAAKKADDPDRSICKSKPVVGSRLKRIRECHTAAEWAEMRRQTRAAIEHIQNSRATSY